VSFDNPSKNRVPLTKIQKLIGQRMLDSKQKKPCFYIDLKADVTELMTLRPKLRKSFGVKITTNAFYIRSLALAVKKYPLVVGILDGDNIRIADQINVGFAVNAPQGLVVPVIKTADEKTLSDIAKEEQLLTEYARDNQLTLEQMENQTIALSNLGAYGIDSFIGIVPPTVSAILAIGNAINTLAVKDGKPAARKMVKLSLAIDSKVIDPVYAAKFLNSIKEQLQEPKLLT